MKSLVDSNKLQSFKFIGYNVCGGSDDGYTIFLFIDREDDNNGFTLSLRDHEGFDDHNQIFFEEGDEIPVELKDNILSNLNKFIEEHQQKPKVVEVINRCISAIDDGL